MDPTKFALALLAAMGCVAAVTLLAAVATRKASPERQASLMPLALAAGFVVGYLLLFEMPRKFFAELWQMPLLIAVLIGGASVPAIAFPRKLVAGPIRLFLVVVCSLIAVGRSNFEHRWFTFALLVGTQVLMLLTLKPLARSRITAGAVPLAFCLAAAASAFVVLYAIDQRLGQMLAIFSAAMGIAALLGLLRISETVVRGGVGFSAILLTILCAIAVYYNEAVPLVVFPLLAAAPLVAIVGFLPALQNRKWWCLGVIAAFSAGVLAPAVVITVWHAPSPF